MAGSSWPDLIAGRTAKASEVEAKFDWLEGDIVPMTGGNQTDSVYYLGTAGARWLGVYTRSINPTTTAGGVAIGTTTANTSALLDIAGAKAVLLPRLTTTERDALTPAAGMVIYNSTLGQFQRYTNAWGILGGTVYRTQPAAQTSSSSAVTTSALNVASGGGRLNGILIAAKGKPSLTVVLDGVSVLTWTAASTGTYCYFLGAAGEVNRQPGGNTDAAGALIEFSGTSSPFLGWDFATSAAIHMAETGGSNATMTVRHIHSLIA